MYIFHAEYMRWCYIPLYISVINSIIKTVSVEWALLFVILTSLHLAENIKYLEES